jgi:hypothetical protein
MVSRWKKERRDPFTKTFPSKVWNMTTSMLTGLKIHDFNCGFKAYRADAAKSLDIYGERHRYLPALAHWDGFRVTELPVPHHPRKFGKTKYGVGRFFNGTMDLLTIMFLRRYLRNPLHFFGLLGLVLMLCGAGVLGYFGIHWIVTGAMRLRPLVLLSLGAVIMGIQFISIGLIGELVISAGPKSGYTLREALE